MDSIIANGFTIFGIGVLGGFMVVTLLSVLGYGIYRALRLLDH